MQILNGKLVRSELTKNARGGSELMAERLVASLPQSLLEHFQIVLSRPVPLDESKLRIYWAHDLAADSAAAVCLDNGRWQNYHKLVFVSYYQREQFVHKFKIPYSHTTVLRNAIDPIIAPKPQNEKIKFIYHTTPHRGLGILLPVFEAIAERSSYKDKVHLDVYSSFQVYGWSEEDKKFQPMFDYIKSKPYMTYHGAVDNQIIREAVVNADVFAYPSVHLETSCLALIEAMAAGCLCVHPDLAALPETAADLTAMYNFDENPEKHAKTLHSILLQVLPALNRDGKERMNYQRGYVNSMYDMKTVRSLQWTNVLESLLNEPRALPAPESEMFVYKQ